MGVQASSTVTYAGMGVLGLNILQSLYVVFDMTHNEISIALTKKGVEVSNIAEFSHYRKDMKGKGKENKNLDSLNSEYDTGGISLDANLPDLSGLNGFNTAQYPADSTNAVPSLEASEPTFAQTSIIPTGPDPPSLVAESPAGVANLNPSSEDPQGFASMQNPGTTAASPLHPTSSDPSAVAQSPANSAIPKAPSADATPLTLPAAINQPLSAQSPAGFNAFLSHSSTKDFTADPTSREENIAFAGGQDWLPRIK